MFRTNETQGLSPGEEIPIFMHLVVSSVPVNATTTDNARVYYIGPESASWLERYWETSEPSLLEQSLFPVPWEAEGLEERGAVISLPPLGALGAEQIERSRGLVELAKRALASLEERENEDVDAWATRLSDDVSQLDD